MFSDVRKTLRSVGNRDWCAFVIPKTKVFIDQQVFADYHIEACSSSRRD